MLALAVLRVADTLVSNIFAKHTVLTSPFQVKSDCFDDATQAVLFYCWSSWPQPASTGCNFSPTTKLQKGLWGLENVTRVTIDIGVSSKEVKFNFGGVQSV